LGVPFSDTLSNRAYDFVFNIWQIKVAYLRLFIKQLHLQFFGFFCFFFIFNCIWTWINLKSSICIWNFWHFNVNIYVFCFSSSSSLNLSSIFNFLKEWSETGSSSILKFRGISISYWHLSSWNLSKKYLSIKFLPEIYHSLVCRLDATKSFRCFKWEVFPIVNKSFFWWYILVMLSLM